MEAQIKLKKEIPKTLFSIIWLFQFPMAMLILKKTKGITNIQILKHFILFCAIWITGIIIVSKIV